MRFSRTLWVSLFTLRDFLFRTREERWGAAVGSHTLCVSYGLGPETRLGLGSFCTSFRTFRPSFFGAEFSFAPKASGFLLIPGSCRSLSSFRRCAVVEAAHRGDHGLAVPADCEIVPGVYARSVRLVSRILSLPIQFAQECFLRTEER